jgi:hypothetical protein
MKDDRRRRQAQHRKARDAQANVERAKANEKTQKRRVEEAKDRLEHTKYLADKAERQAEGHLLRMRTGYAEGTKLFFEMFKTQATLTTGSIIVIAALSEGLLPANEAYRPLLWFSYVSLLFAMLASLKTMDIVTSSVLSTLTSEERPPPVVPEDEADVRAREADEAKKAAAIEQASEWSHSILQRRSRWASWSFYAGIGSFALFVIAPPLVDLVGIVEAALVIAIAALVTVYLYRRF